MDCGRDQLGNGAAAPRIAVKPGLKRALVHVSAWSYELSLNGKKVGDDLLTPGWTNTTGLPL